LGSDLGNAIKGFRSAMREEDDSAKKSEKPRTLEGEVESKEGTRQS
jgi:Sec-independent protein translocase protein TatA